MYFQIVLILTSMITKYYLVVRQERCSRVDTPAILPGWSSLARISSSALHFTSIGEPRLTKRQISQKMKIRVNLNIVFLEHYTLLYIQILWYYCFQRRARDWRSREESWHLMRHWRLSHMYYSFLSYTVLYLNPLFYQ